MNNLQKLREDRDIKQLEVAKYLGISQPAYSKIEKNIECAKAPTLIKLALFFNVSIDFILGLVEQPISLKRENTNNLLSNKSIVLKSSDREYLEKAIEFINKILDQ